MSQAVEIAIKALQHISCGGASTRHEIEMMDVASEALASIFNVERVSKYTVEGVVTPEPYPEKDPEIVICDTFGGEDSPLVVRLSSYDPSLVHGIIEDLRGKRVRVTVEVID